MIKAIPEFSEWLFYGLIFSGYVVKQKKLQEELFVNYSLADIHTPD